MYEENQNLEQEEKNETVQLNELNSTNEAPPIEEYTQLYKQSRMEPKPPRSSKLKTFFMTVTAGVIGSAVTLTAVPYLPNYHETPNAAVSENVNQSSQASNVDVKHVSASANSLADTIEQASKAIVGIVNYQQQGNRFQQASKEVKTGSGSGVIFKKTGDAAYIVTNNHVIENADKVEVTLQNGENMTAELIGTDPLSDIAVIKVSGKINAEPLNFGDSSLLRAGDQVLAIGNPLGLDLSRTVTQGIVSAVNRSIAVSTSAGEWDVDVIQTDAAINPGNSGGALINTSGQLIGINSMKISESGVEGLGFAIPSNEVQKIINEILENGQVVRPYFGVGLTNLEDIPRFYLPNLPDSVTKGAVVTNVDPNSAAAKAGIQVQDIIVSIGGTEINNSNEFRKTLYSKYAIGDKVQIKFYRQGVLKTVEATLTSNKNKNS